MQLEGESGYPVLIGRTLLASVREFVPSGVLKIAVITQREIPYKLDFGEIESEVFFIPNGESAKTLATVESLVESLARFGLSRRDLIVCLGGGVVTDIGGFVASIYYRGIRYINVATTLLAQIDAAIGGKTGVNLKHGKNLAGTFWQPLAVFCDIDTLQSLPERELRSGFGEMAKYEFLGSGQLTGHDLVDDVTKCVSIKAGVVSRDEHEGGERALLNYGHTLGHALEALALVGKGDYLYHGEAVAIGLVFAVHLAYNLKRATIEDVERHYSIVRKFGLDPTLPAHVDCESILPYLYRDKKAHGSLTFVLLNGSKDLEVVEGVTEDDICRAVAVMKEYL